MFLTRDNRMSCEGPVLIIYGRGEERMEKVSPTFGLRCFGRRKVVSMQYNLQSTTRAQSRTQDIQ